MEMDRGLLSANGKNWNEPPPLERKILLDFQKPFDLIPQYKSTYKNRVFSQEGAIAPSCPSKTQPSQIWSQLLNAARTYFERLIVEV
jgi:hypothetical protein